MAEEADSTNAAIMHKLGMMEAKVEHADSSRAVIHEKIDKTNEMLIETNHTLVRLATNLEITSKVAVQARDEFRVFKEEFKTEHLPTIKQSVSFQENAEPILKVMRMVRNVVLILMAFGILTAGTALTMFFFARDMLAAVVRLILGL